MDKFWIGVAAAQNANVDAAAKSAKRLHLVLPIVGGIAIALLVVAGMFVVAALNN